VVQNSTHLAPQGERLNIRRHEILAAASGLFRSHGFHSTGMRDIAAAAGMTVGNLYYYFENKQDLLAFCQEDAVRRLLSMAHRVTPVDLDAASKLWLLIVGHIRCLNEGVPGSLAHLQVEELAAPARRRIVRLRDQYETMLRDLVEQGSAQQCFQPTDAPIAVRAVLGAVNWTVQWYRPKGRMSLTRISETFATQLVRGFLKAGVAFEPPDDKLLDETASIAPVAAGALPGGHA
jgi:AcrR family transcriptional regulator